MVLESWKRRAEALEDELYALYLAPRDSRSPTSARVVIGLTVAYAVSPIDPVPDEEVYPIHHDDY